MTVRLDGIDLVVFDKDGTLIDFGAMWRAWAVEVARRLDAATGRSVEGPLFAMFGYDPVARVVRPGGGLAATPMARLRERTATLLGEAGLGPADAEQALADAWHAPDPVALAHPLVDLVPLLRGLRADGRRIAIATSDDRAPTERTMAALGMADLVDATVCADDGVAVKPAPDMVLDLCRRLSVRPDRTAVVGDSVADLAMGRAAGVAMVVGVLTGVGDAAALGDMADVVVASVAELLPTPD